LLQIELNTSESHLVNVIDLSGRIVMTERTNGLNTTIDLNELSKGNYFIEVISNQGNVVFERKQVVKL